MIVGIEWLIGIVVSLIVVGIKKYLKTEEYATLGVVAVVSLIGAAAYYFLSQTVAWEVFVEIATVAGAFYTYIIERFKSE